MILALLSPFATSQENLAPDNAAVQVQMHGVMYHFTDGIAIYIYDLGGQLIPASARQIPTFDDKNSFTIKIDAAEISMSPESLSNLLNSRVFAGNDAPLKQISVRIEGGRLKVNGKLHRKGDIPFELVEQPSVTADGKIALHASSIKALHLPIKGLMDLLGLDLADLIKSGKVQGVSAYKDDLILDPEQILPPPHMSGHLTQIRLQDGKIVQIFGNLQQYKWLRIPARNYMAYRGNRLRFGKLTMQDTDMILIDMDPQDPFDFYLDHYQEQLSAGYSKTTRESGLRVFMRDYDKLATRGQQSKAGR